MEESVDLSKMSRGTMNGHHLRIFVDEDFDCLKFSASEVREAIKVYNKRKGIKTYTHGEWEKRKIRANVREIQSKKAKQL
jgi:hypothetical protein